MSKVQICSVKEFVNSIKSICVQFGLVDYSLQSKVVYSLCLFKLVNNIDVDKDLIKSQTNYVCDNAERTVEELLQYVSDDRKNDFCVQISDFLENVDVEIDNDKNFLSQVFDCLKSEKIQRMKYAEFFTPQNIADLMAEIMCVNSKEKSAEIYDPCAGSGTLVFSLANKLYDKGIKNQKVFVQEISKDTTKLLIINLIVNGLLSNPECICVDDTLLNPGFKEESGDLKRFDYVVCNPPFKYDFSEVRDLIVSNWCNSPEHDGFKRFFAGVPNGNVNAKDRMSIYLCFLQHVIYSLKSNGKAAVIVPNGFLTSDNKMELEIREVLIKNNWLEGVIALPSKLFSTTGTRAAIIFINKKKDNDDNVLFFNASKCASDQDDEMLNGVGYKMIKNAFVIGEQTSYSRSVSNEIVKLNEYSFNPARYVEVSNKQQSDFEMKINTVVNEIASLERKRRRLYTILKKDLEDLDNKK